MRRTLLALVFAVCWPLSTAQALPGGNMMAAQASPYLQSHAKDGVHWRPWGKAALDEARRLKRPVFLSIGYLACHWCHVMQRESFLGGETAALINELFVPVLIDREERPDLDAFFQHAASLLDLPTGWPLTMFLTDEGQPFFGATYIPNKAGLGMPALADVLRQVSAHFQSDPAGVTHDARLVARALAAVNRPRAGDVSPKTRTTAAKAYLEEADNLSGGFGKEAKFPNWPALIVLWRHHLRTGDAAAGEFVRDSLREMVRGTLFDHVGGGFFRYTTDPAWRVPHFEKMLDVNAGMLRLMTMVWRETRDAELETAIRRTVDFLLAEMRHSKGGFISSLDADSLDPDGIEREGAFYRWRESDVRNTLGAGADSFFNAYAIAPLEGPVDEDDADWGTVYRLGDRTDLPIMASLAEARSGRKAPKRDTKLLADGNGLAIRAFAEAGFALGEPGWIDAARQALAQVSIALTGPGGKLHQSAVVTAGGVRSGPLATLSAVAAMGHAAISLFEATGNHHDLVQSETWARLIVERYADTAVPGYTASAQEAADVPVNLRPVIDDPNPSGNATAISLFARLYFHTGKPEWRRYASETLTGLGGLLVPPQLGTAGMINAADDILAALQVVIIGRRGSADVDALVDAVMRRSLPAQILQIVPPGTELPASHPAYRKSQIDGKATAYVCRGTVCSLPAIAAPELDENLAIFRKDPK